MFFLIVKLKLLQIVLFKCLFNIENDIIRMIFWLFNTFFVIIIYYHILEKYKQTLKKSHFIFN